MLTDEQKHEVRSVLLDVLVEREGAYYERLQSAKKIQVDTETKAEIRSIATDVAWKKSSHYFIIAVAISVLGPPLGFLGGYLLKNYIEGHVAGEVQALDDDLGEATRKVAGLSERLQMIANFPPIIICDFENQGKVDRRALYFYATNDSGVAEYRLENTGGSYSVIVSSDLDITYKGSRSHGDRYFTTSGGSRFLCPPNLKDLYDAGRVWGFVPDRQQDKSRE